MESRPSAAGAAFVSAGAFAWLAHAVARGQTAAFDVAARNDVHAWASPGLTLALRAVTELGSAAVLIPLAAVMVWRLWEERRAVALLAVTTLGGEAIDQLLKLVFHRPRPEAFFGLAQPETYAFPSGHSIVSCCFYGLGAAILAARETSRARRAAIWTVAVLVILGVGCSRVYLGVHYPTDVLGGYLAAAAWLAALRAVVPACSHR